MQRNKGLQIVELEITNRCNLDCRHCYVDKSHSADLGSKKVYGLIDECQKMRIHRLVLTGGEPLLVSRVFEFAQYAKKKKIPQVVLQTNGLLITKNNVEKFKIFNLVQLSIDMPLGEKAHFRKDYSVQLTKKIQLLKSHKINLILQATIHKSILPVLDNLGKFAQKNNIFIGFNRLSAVGRAAELKGDFFSPSEFKEALTGISRAKKKYGKLIRCSDPLFFLIDKDRMKYFNSLQGNKGEKILGGCIAGIAALYVGAKGDVYPCSFLRYSIGNVSKNSLEQIWLKSAEIKKIRERKKFLGNCGKCKYVFYCGGYRTGSFLKTGKLTGPDPLCWLHKHI